MIITKLTADQLEKAAEMLKAMAHPARIAILNFLEDGKKRTVTQIHESIGIEQSAASHHLGILRNKGVLLVTREGKNAYYSLKHDKLSNLVECLNSCACN